MCAMGCAHLVQQGVQGVVARQRTGVLGQRAAGGAAARQRIRRRQQQRAARAAAAAARARAARRRHVRGQRAHRAAAAVCHSVHSTLTITTILTELFLSRLFIGCQQQCLGNGHAVSHKGEVKVPMAAAMAPTPRHKPRSRVKTLARCGSSAVNGTDATTRSTSSGSNSASLSISACTANTIRIDNLYPLFFHTLHICSIFYVVNPRK